MSVLPPQLTVQADPEGPMVRLRVSGEVDLASADRLGDALRQAQGEHRAVILDLSEVSFIDSTGLRLILDAQEHARRDGWQMVVDRRLGTSVQRLFELTAAIGLIDWHP